MRSFLVGLFSVTALFAVSEGELTFSVAGDNYVSHGAQGVLQTLKNQKRIVVAVKDRDAKFLFALTVDVPQESETQTLHLNTHDSVMSVVFRSTKGSMAIMPVVQFAKEDPNAIEIERIEKETNEYESESPADAKLRKRRHNDPHPPRKKLHVEYRRVKPRWHSMTKEERLRSGGGIIKNESFQDTFFSVRLTPVLSQGKVVAYQGSFSGVGRFSSAVQGATLIPIQNGSFYVKVQYAN